MGHLGYMREQSQIWSGALEGDLGRLGGDLGHYARMPRMQQAWRFINTRVMRVMRSSESPREIFLGSSVYTPQSARTCTGA